MLRQARNGLGISTLTLPIIRSVWKMLTPNLPRFQARPQKCIHTTLGSKPLRYYTTYFQLVIYYDLQQGLRS
jgi:hypothetical protein